jgi:2-keto-4-pentenoate hydratase/2-oxohepta-3-ene-1,7-dioic acid hydratase in catechol pathway
MKICTFKKSTPFGEIKRLGIIIDSALIIDVNSVWQSEYERQGFYSPKSRAHTFAPSDLNSFIALYQDSSIQKLQHTIELFHQITQAGITKTQDSADLSFSLIKDTNLKLHSPIENIPMYRDFYAHEKHVKKGFEKRNEPIPPAWYEIPAYYKGGTTGFIGPDDIIPWPHYSKQLDYELELGVVIGRDGKNIKSTDVRKHIFGFTILNDISARDIQKKEMSIRLGPSKAKDWCSIIGPVIVTFDEFNYEEPDLEMIATINGNEWSRGQSGDAHYSFGEMIEYMSMEEWIRATEFIGSGTVGTGCGLELDRWIQPGDLIELSIDKIGTLKNIVGTPA